MKFIFVSLVFVSCFTSFLQAQTCLKESKKFFNSKDYISAEHALEKCSENEKKNSNVQISIGGIKLLLAKYDEANTCFENALKTMPTNSPYFAYVYSSLGDIAMRKNQTQKALKSYENALKYEAADLNALVGYGLTLEKTGNKTEAAKNYKKALEIDFSNLEARKGLIRLEPDCLNDKEKLSALKDRNIIAPEAQTFTEEDINILRKILKAERGSSLEYLSMKYGNGLPEGTSFERNPNTFYARKMLTLSGYRLLMEKLSSDAKEFFLSKKVIASDLFSLTDLNGKPIFDEKGILTDEGLVAYNRSLKGKKSYLLPGEKSPANKEKDMALVKELLSEGYEEVTRLEFQYVEQETLCPEVTLVKNLKCKVIGEGKNKRFFVSAREDDTPPFSVPLMFVEQYRELYGKHNKDYSPVYKDTFGENQRALPKLCNKKGELAGI